MSVRGQQSDVTRALVIVDRVIGVLGLIAQSDLDELKQLLEDIDRRETKRKPSQRKGFKAKKKPAAKKAAKKKAAR